MREELQSLHSKITQRLGACPPLFRSPAGLDEAAADLWLQYERGYLDNPLPAPTRERIMVCLARLGDSPYMLARHCAVLLGRADKGLGLHPQSLSAVRRLLERPLPTPEQLARRRASLAGRSDTGWPEPDSESEGLLIDAALGIYLQPAETRDWLKALGAAFGTRSQEPVMRLVNVARCCHYWTVQHQDLEEEPELRDLRDDLPELTRWAPADDGMRELAPVVRSRLAPPALGGAVEVLNGVLRGMGIGLIVQRGSEIVFMNDLAISMNGVPGRGEGIRRCAGDDDLTEAYYLLDERGARMPFEQWPNVRAREGESFSELQATVCNRRTGRSWTGVFAGHPIDAGERLFAVTMRDVTHRVETEAALRRSEERLRLALASAHMGTWEFDFDARLILLDERCQDIFGLKDRSSVTFEEAIRLIGEEEQPQIDEQIARVLNPDQTGDYDVEGRITRADGQIRWIRAVGSVVFDEGSEERRPTQLSGVIMDVTGSKRADAELRQSEDRFREAFARAPIGMLLADLSGRFLHVNQAFCRIVGYDGDELIGSDLDLLRLAHPADAARSRVAFERVLAREIPGFFMEKRWQRKDGRFIWVRLSVSVRRGGSGKPSQLVALVEDIDDRHRAEEELRWSEERLRRLAAGLEDQVAARTNSLKEYAERLQQLALDLTSAEQRERKRLAAILHDHIQQLLVATHMRLAAARRQVNDECGGLLRQAMELVEEAAEAARDLTTQLRPPVLYEGGLVQALRWLAEDIEDKHGLHVTLDAKPIGEPGDAVRGLVFEAVRELLFNTVKHAGVLDARVVVEPLPGDEGIRVVVSDQGMGFEPPREEGGGGTHGFGVFSVRERLMAFGGEFQLDAAPGHGVRVELKVPALRGPVAQRQEVSRTYTPHPAPRESDGEGIRVLLADDHRMVRDGLASILRRWSDIVVVGEASDGQEAIELTEVLRPQVVLMDVNMPRLSGIEATRAIKARWPAISVFGLSVHAERAVARAMVEAGASGYFSKGVDSQALVEAIRRVAGPPQRQN